MSKNVNNDVSMNPPIDVSISKNTALSTLNLPLFLLEVTSNMALKDTK